MQFTQPRRFVRALSLAALALASSHAWPQAQPQRADSLNTKVPLLAPSTELVYEAIVDIAPSMALGDGPLGERRMVPITGGEFAGAGLHGKVLAGGADRQLIRKDGVKRLDALYELQTDDGAVITVRNQVLIDQPANAKRYTFSTIDITAPEGKYGWLNRAVYVGTLDSLKPARNAVLIRVFRVK